MTHHIFLPPSINLKIPFPQQYNIVILSISRPQPKYNISSLNTGKEYKGVYKIAKKFD